MDPLLPNPGSDLCFTTSLLPMEYLKYFQVYAMDYFNQAKLEAETQPPQEGDIDEISQEGSKSMVDKGKLREALGGAGEADAGLSARRARKSSNLLQQLRNQMTRKLSINEGYSDSPSPLGVTVSAGSASGYMNKSYRIISGGEDSQIMFWRFDRRYDPNDYPTQAPFLQRTNEEFITNPSSIPQIKPIAHQTIWVGQLQQIILANELIFIVDSEGVVTVLRAIFKSTLTATAKKQAAMLSADELPQQSDADLIDGLETEPMIRPDLIESRPIRPTKDLHNPNPVMEQVPQKQ